MKKAEHRTPNAERRTPNNGEFGTWVLHDGNPGGKKYGLEKRLLEFASTIIDLSEKLPNSRAGNHVAGQVLRSGTSPDAIHGEAESAESRVDFIHKIKLCFKELRETPRWARLIHRKYWAQNDSALLFALSESEELIRIFMSSIRAARTNALSAQATGKTNSSRS